MDERLLSPREVAAYTHLSYKTVLQAIEAGELPASRLRGRLRISRYDMLGWIHDNQVRPKIRPRYQATLKRRTQHGSLRALLDTEGTT